MPPKHAVCAVSNAIKKALAHTDYKCLGSGKIMNLKGRDIVHQNLHPKIAAQERLFHPNSSLNWLQIDDPELGMHSIKYARLPGLTEQGVTEMGQGGLEHLHWHKETQHYFVYRGIGIFQIGDQIVEVDANKDPTLIIIPGNTPHQILNEKEEPLMFFYYFPEHESFDHDITYYFPDGTNQPPGADWLN